MSKVQVEANEAKYFRQYVSEIMDKHEQTLSFFELNLEVQVHKILNNIKILQMEAGLLLVLILNTNYLVK